MPINGFQLSQSQTMDSGSRTKKPDDNREAMLKHEETREEALYGTMELLKDSSHSMADPDERQLLRAAGARPKYISNIRKAPMKQRFNLKDTYLDMTFVKKV